MWYIAEKLGVYCLERDGFDGKGIHLSVADEYADQQNTDLNTDMGQSDKERAMARKERLAAVEARMTRQVRNTMRMKKKTTSHLPLRGPNSRNTMQWSSG